MENGNTYNQQNFNQNQYSQPQNIGPAPSGTGYKSATVAGLLGIFLGTFGIHDFYLGDKQKGIKHVILASVWIVADVLSGIILPNALSFSMLLTLGWLLSVLGIIGGICAAISSIWGLVDGIKILVAGDAGLAQRGIPVAPQAARPMNFGNYNQPMSNQNMGSPVQNQPTAPERSAASENSDNQEPANGANQG